MLDVQQTFSPHYTGNYWCSVSNRRQIQSIRYTLGVFFRKFSHTIAGSTTQLSEFTHLTLSANPADNGRFQIAAVFEIAAVFKMTVAFDVATALIDIHRVHVNGPAHFSCDFGFFQLQ